MNNCYEKIKKKWEDKWADICRKIRCWSDRSFIINGIIFLLLIFLAPILFKLFPCVYVAIALALALAVLFGLFILFYRYLLLFIAILTLISSIFIPLPYDIVIFLIVFIGLLSFLYFRYFLLCLIGILAFISLLLFALGVSIKLELLGDVNCLIIQKLCNLFIEEESVYTLMNVGIAFGGLMTLLFYQWRNQAIEEQTKTQYETFNQDKQFSNYLEATKLLTGENSTTDAKIAAMFSLAGVARDHPKDVGRIIQVINQSLILRKNLQENSKETSKETIKSWRHTGDFVERTFSTALYVIRKIILGLQSSNTNVDISNTVIFDVDTDFYEEAIKIDTLFSVVGKERPVENLTFFHCKLEKIDIIKEARYHFCQFRNCNLTKANFNRANLWGTSFIDCDLEGVKFKNTECEGVKFTECKNLSLKQLEKMEFKNRSKFKAYFLIKGLKEQVKRTEDTINEIGKYFDKNPKKEKIALTTMIEEYFDKNPKKDMKDCINHINEKFGTNWKNSICRYTKLKYPIIIEEKNKKLTNEEKNEELEMENFITSDEYDEWKNSPKIDNDDKNKKSSRK